MAEPFLKENSYKITRQHVPILIPTLLIVIAYGLHTVFQQTTWAWLVWGLVLAALTYTKLLKTSHAGLIALGVAIMMMTPINTHISFEHFIFMTSGIFLSVFLPYVIAHHYFKHPLIHFNLDLRRKWSMTEIGYVVFAVIGCAISLYVYFTTTDAHLNWPLGSFSDIIIVFASIMIIGIWEEFFFIGTVYGILQRLLPYAWAIILQAIMFTGFLYQVGFRGWIVPLVFVYTIFQGYVFHKTKTLLITLVIHVLVDLGVFVNLLLAAHVL